MLDKDRAARRRLAGLASTLAIAAALSGSTATAAEACSWAKTPSGADFGTCTESSGRAYCVICQYAPRVCVRTPC
jgi:hypothetical protein